MPNILFVFKLLNCTYINKVFAVLYQFKNSDLILSELCKRIKFLIKIMYF